MVHEALLNAYVFDFLRKKGFHQTAIHFADECKDLPLLDTSVDEQVEDLSKTDEASSKGRSSSPAPAKDDDATLKGSHQNLQQRKMPQVSVPINTPQGFLLEWWSIFWDVFAANSERSKTQIPDSIRAYVSHQQGQRHGRRPSTAPAHANGKRSALQIGETSPEDTANPLSARIDSIDTQSATKRLRVAEETERSPQSAALVAKYSFTGSMDPLELPEAQEQDQNGSYTRNAAALPRNLGVNINPGGDHMLSEEYAGFLTRSLKVVAEGQTTHSSTDNYQGKLAKISF
ncbi:Transcriptional activator flo8 [Coemansia sp. RSA 2703]|nr:Transcriptional activator flo8 [Coemansia sp. RSA 2703]